MEIETVGLGAGSYPEPPEDKNKCYVVHCNCSINMDITIYAENQDQARELVMSGDYEERSYNDYEIEEIESIEEEV